jgi:hypothetical protein
VCADWWAHEKTRTSEDETEDAPLLPEHMCTNEAERHAWRADVLQFIRDHLEPAETYHLCAADLEIDELLPSRPEWLTQDEYEERTTLRKAGTIAWSGRRLRPAKPAGKVRGDRTVADLVVENRE